MMRVVRRPVLSALFGVLTMAVLAICPQVTARAAGPRIDLQVLVVTDGGAPVSAVADQLKIEGVPYRTVDLRKADRPVIDAAFLSDTVDGVPRAKYQAVVLPNASPFQNGTELAALADYEKRFGIRQLDAYVHPSAAVGLSAPTYSGNLDGATAQVSAAGKADAFRYLRGPVKFDDVSADVGESYGFLATPLPDDPATGRSFQTFLTATVKGATGTLVGAFNHDGRSELVLSYANNAQQFQLRTIGHGLITWLTKGVHLGYARNYLGVHVDDVFLPDARWSTEDDCTPGEDCEDEEVETEDIRMQPEDVTFAASWQAQRAFMFDMAYNGAGSDEEIAKHEEDPLTDEFVADKDRFRWLNHTYGHTFLGCVQDISVRPWRCATDPDTREIKYVGEAAIKQEAVKNLEWAAKHGIPVRPSELVTGEHSGLRILPQQPDDNPNLAPALSEADVKWVAGDASRDRGQRKLGALRTVPRHPLSVFFNVATEEEEVDEYNWIYTRRSDGGSGICEDNPSTTTCIEPLDPDTGYTSYIVPTDARITLSHVLGNDPRPHYAHQSNITEDQILYPLLDRVLGEYRTAFADNSPIVNEPMSVLGGELARQDEWRAALRDDAVAKGDVTAYLQDGTITVKSAVKGLDVPITAPEGTREGSELFGNAYAGERSAYKAGDVTLTPPGA
ncbi:hypothetical protein [Actinomadura rubrisoli]|uniref:Secreted protein n=1 Tax=Actinomadura rubrisoli TaxID=2530368 RepID=A0A4R5ASB2_9ACTN|nr:hypothetical protein [Actinomadura rubrisoli]TDD73302.1 hypothetical protein E1298_34335 [Actinomadura rubrisoli]